MIYVFKLEDADVWKFDNRAKMGTGGQPATRFIPRAEEIANRGDTILICSGKFREDYSNGDFGNDMKAKIRHCMGNSFSRMEFTDARPKDILKHSGFCRGWADS